MAEREDGWRHIYTVGRNGQEKLLTKGNFDVISMKQIDEKKGVIYFTASPDNATQTYLYQVPLKGGAAKRVTSKELAGSHSYDISPNGQLALHTFSNSSTFPVADVVSLPAHQRLSGGEVPERAKTMKLSKPEFFQVTKARSCSAPPVPAT